MSSQTSSQVEMTLNEAQCLLEDAQVNRLDWSLRVVMVLSSIYAFALGQMNQTVRCMDIPYNRCAVPS